MKRTAWILIAVLAAGGCTGAIGGDDHDDTPSSPGGGPVTPGRDPGAPATPGSPGGPVAAACPANAGLTPRRIRRLANREYANVVADLTGQNLDVSALLPENPRDDGFDNGAESLIVTSSHAEAYAGVAEKMAGALDADRLAACTTGEAPDACATRFVRGFGRRAYGRPLSDDEVKRLVAVYRVGQEGATFKAGLQLAVEAMLQSPAFLYVTELGDPASDGAATTRLTQHEVANRLSFLFTGARPDEALLALADKGALKDAELARQAERLLALPRAKEQLRELFFGWLGLHGAATIEKSRTLYPEFTPAVRAAMIEEITRFIDDVLWRGTGTLNELLTSSSVGVPAALKTVYGADLLEAPGAGRVRLDPRRRKGVLSLASLLTTHAGADHSGPVRRGVFVRERLFCQHLPSPPPDVVDVIPVDPQNRRTTRQRFAQHTSDGSCATCHAMIDPIGFGFEQMDAIGRFRTTEVGQPVDSSGALTGTDVDGAFTGPAELADRVASSAAVARCFTTQLFRFVEARVDGADDRCEVDAMTDVLRRQETRVRDLLLAVVQRPRFTTRQQER